LTAANLSYDPDVEGTIFNIQRFSVHDGPGIRTVVFVKGCSLRCIWCSNPESLVTHRQLGVYPQRCIGVDKCGMCLKVAPDADAFRVEDNRVTALTAHHHEDYLVCAEVCPTDALKAWGEKTTVGAVMKEVLADRDFYRESGGGMTLSGGEALIQKRFAAELLKAARAEGLNTCVETALNYRPDVLDATLPYIDLAFCDLKHIETTHHQRFTGVPNRQILDNLKRVVASGTPVVIRIPVVPGYNGTEENMRETARFVADELGGGVRQIQLLPFHKLGEDKYASLGMRYPMADFTTPEREVWEADIRHFVSVMRSYGVPAVAGSGSKLEI
jgi:pyruvate formate lyase activating enzyme